MLTNVFSSWSASKEWSVNLPKEESVVLLTVSNTLLGVVSDLQYVRTWSLGGLQRHVISLPGLLSVLLSIFCLICSLSLCKIFIIFFGERWTELKGAVWLSFYSCNNEDLGTQAINRMDLQYAGLLFYLTKS